MGSPFFFNRRQRERKSLLLFRLSRGSCRRDEDEAIRKREKRRSLRYRSSALFLKGQRKKKGKKVSRERERESEKRRKERANEEEEKLARSSSLLSLFFSKSTFFPCPARQLSPCRTGSLNVRFDCRHPCVSFLGRISARAAAKERVISPRGGSLLLLLFLIEEQPSSIVTFSFLLLASPFYSPARSKLPTRSGCLTRSLCPIGGEADAVEGRSKTRRGAE